LNLTGAGGGGKKAFGGGGGGGFFRYCRYQLGKLPSLSLSTVALYKSLTSTALAPTLFETMPH